MPKTKVPKIMEYSSAYLETKKKMEKMIKDISFENEIQKGNEKPQFINMDKKN